MRKLAIVLLPACTALSTGNVDQPVVTCTQRDQGCAPNSTISFAGATATGDNSTFIDSDHLGTILLGGAPYEVRLYAANERSDTIATFVVDANDGTLIPDGAPITWPKPVCILPV